MRPRIKSQVYWLYVTRDHEVRLPWGWQVFWELEGKPKVTHFWTWPAAVDFALERVLDFRKINHPHLWM
jgi:hypothetical protein